MTTITQTIPSLGSPPLTTDPANFDTRADTLYGTSLPAVITATNTWSGQANTVAGEVNTNATNSATSATESATARTAAEAAQAAAQSASNATQWVSGQAYVAGNVVWSPSTYLSYRAVGATSGTTDPSQSASWVLLAVDVRSFTNPLAQAIFVQMTAATSGSNGIQQLSNVQNNFGLGDFTLHWDGVTSGTTTTAHLISKIGTYGYELIQLSTGRLRLSITGSLGTNQPESTVSNTKTNVKLTATYSRGSPNDTLTFYVDGVQLGTAVTTPTKGIIDPTAALNISGRSSGLRENTQTRQALIFNRALTASEVLDLSINGVALADRGASQLTPISGNAQNGTSTRALTSFVGTTTGFSGSASSSTGTSRQGGWTLNAQSGKRYKVKFSYVANATAGGTLELSARISTSTSDLTAVSNTETVSGTTTMTGTLTTELVATSTGAFFAAVTIRSPSAAASIDITVTDYSIIQVGITSELLASNAQSDTGQIFDTSGNKNHALLPASGATVVGRPVSQTREVRWTNTWAGTNELQYIGGVNQAILPANAYIESIVGTVSGATPHDIIVGDGSDADRYVTITTGLAAGTTTFTLANRTTDGTNLKLTVDPDTNATMSIAWVISYKTLES
jgi:hypothetical protein